MRFSLSIAGTLAGLWIVRRLKSRREIVQLSRYTRRVSEQSAKSSTQSYADEMGGAKGGAIELQIVIEAWPLLSAADRRKIVSIARRALGK